MSRPSPKRAAVEAYALAIPRFYDFVPDVPCPTPAAVDIHAPLLGKRLPMPLHVLDGLPVLFVRVLVRCGASAQIKHDQTLLGTLFSNHFSVCSRSSVIPTPRPDLPAAHQSPVILENCPAMRMLWAAVMPRELR